MAILPKAERFKMFIALLENLPGAGSEDEARMQLARTLNTIEDAHSGVPFDPANWRTDGRMYPVQDDSASDVSGYPNVTAYRSRGHETFIATNGALEIRRVDDGYVEIRKPGSHGRDVWS